MKRFLWLFLGVIASHQIVADEGDYHINLGVGLVNEQLLLLPSGTELSDEFIPYFELGVGKEYVLSPNWRLSADLNLAYSEGDVDLSQNTAGTPFSSKFKNIGLWADSTIKYTALFDNARPFLSVGVGRIYGEFSDSESNLSGWDSGYRVSTGFEFDLGKKSSFSVGLGTGNVGQLD